MGLRNILISTSLIIIGFCLTLYFQADQSVQTLNWDQYKNLQYHDDRSHSLDEFNKKIAPTKLQDLIKEVYEKNRLAGQKTRVMEIGAGNGRVVMELKKLFPHVEFYAINKEKTHTFYRRESFILSALKFEIFNKDEIENIELPYVVFEDLDFGGKIPYNNNKFDVIYSQNTISSIKYKFELFKEVIRVLRSGGVAYFTDLAGLNVYDNGLIMELKDALAVFRRKGLEINLLENRHGLRFKKTRKNFSFPVSPHQPIPDNTTLSKELRRPDMGYNLIH